MCGFYSFDHLLFSDVILFHIIRYSKFQSVASITLHFPENFGGDTTQIHYIGLKGEATQVISLPQKGLMVVIGHTLLGGKKGVVAGTMISLICSLAYYYS
jgi:hypothetical protein